MPPQSRSARLFERRVIQLAERRPAPGLLYAARGTGRRRAARHVRSLHTHTNPAHEFVYTIKGQASIVTPKQVFSLSPGQLLLIDPGVEHGELPPDRPRPYSVFWCALELSYAVLCPTTYHPATGWRAGQFMELTGRTDVQSIATAIGTEIASRNWGWEEATHGLLQYLACILVRRIRRGSIVRIPPSESPTIARDPRAWQVIHAALQFCRANFRRSLHLREVAVAVGYSPGHLNYLFTSHLGHSVSDHVRELRLSAARDLLENTDMPVSLIAAAVGYSRPSHFTRAFSRIHGLSPKAYRQRSQAA